MSLQECALEMKSKGSATINAGEFSLDDLESAATLARARQARLIIYNLKGRSCEEIFRITQAGGLHVSLGDLHLI
jgi:hypothetical protein